MLFVAENQIDLDGTVFQNLTLLQLLTATQQMRTKL